MKRKDIESTEEVGGQTVVTFKDGTVKRFEKVGGGSFKTEPPTPRHKQPKTRRSASGNIILQRLRAEDAKTDQVNEAASEPAEVKKPTDDTTKS